MLIAAALTIALVLTAYTVHTILSYKPRHVRSSNLPSQAFIASFAQPKVVAQDLGQDREAYARAFAQALLTQIDATLTLAQSWGQPITPQSDEDWKRYAEACVSHSPYIPTGREYDAMLAAEPVIAAKVDTDAPAKRVRVYHLAEEFGVLSADVRLWLEHECGIATKSASSTVSAQEANRLREWVSTHMDV